MGLQDPELFTQFPPGTDISHCSRGEGLLAGGNNLEDFSEILAGHSEQPAYFEQKIGPPRRDPLKSDLFQVQ